MADSASPVSAAPVCRMIPIEQHIDARGCLTTLQSGRDIPFEIKRVYTIFQVGSGQRRGCHAHRLERQLIVCMHGRCTIKVSDGWQTETHLLDSPLLGLLIDRVIWREMDDFTPDCVLMVLSDCAYDAQDYIRDYAEFLALVRPAT